MSYQGATGGTSARSARSGYRRGKHRLIGGIPKRGVIDQHAIAHREQRETCRSISGMRTRRVDGQGKARHDACADRA